MPPGADAVLALISGVPLVALGGLLLALRPRRRQQVFFGLFAVLWGLQVLTANLGRVVCDAALHQTALLVSHGFMAAATLFLAHFAGLVRGGSNAWVPGAIAGTFGVAAVGVYLVAPELLVEGATAAECQLVTTYGPLLAPLIQIPFFLTFVAATAYLHHAYRRARPGTTRHLLRGVIVALTLFASYQFVRTTVAFLHFGDPAQFASGAVAVSTEWSGLLLVASFLLGTVLLGAVVSYAAWRPPPPEARDLALVAAFLAPALVALAEDVFQDLSLLSLETLGFWRLASVAVLVYTLAQNQVFGIELRLKRLAGPGTAGAIGLFGVPLALSLAQGQFGLRATFLTLLPEFIAIGAVLAFRDRIGARMFPGVNETIEYQHQRRLELYKVALEDAVERDLDPEGPGLQQARARFGITDDEHRMLLWMATSHKRHDPLHGTALAPGHVVLGRYRLEKTLGERTQRETLLATDVHSRQKVVVKAVALDAYDGAGVALLTREARLGASITHPHVLPVFDVAEEGDHLLIVMDYADLGNLEDRLADGPLESSTAIRFASELLAGLEAIHERAIVHTNLKPANILFDADGRVLITDLSAARRSDDATARAAGTDAESLATHILYDPLYQSPEQLRGETATVQSDLYVAGLLLHLVLTGRYPYPITGCSDAQIRTLRLEHPPQPSLDDRHAWAAAVVLRALERDAAARYASAAEMRADLHERAGLPAPR